MDAIDRAARLLAASLTAPRFRGRAACQRLATAGDLTALTALESDARARELAALRGDLSPEVVRALALPSVARQLEVRAARAKARSRRDALAERQPGQARARAAQALIARALRKADLRGATHSHDTTIEWVAPGLEAGRSDTGSLRPSAVGLPNAYSRRGYWVTSSSHTIRASTRILTAPRSERGVLYLAPDVRVRQSRGTSLVTERRSGPRGGWAAAS